MTAIYAWGLDLIRTIQLIKSPPLTVIMQGITFFGSELIYLLLLPFFFWCVDEKKGLRLGILVLLSAWINISLKDLFKQPRPYDLAPELGLAKESSYGIPSGHAQNSLVFWFNIALWKKNIMRYIPALLITLVIGFTRLYLGVHFPTDLFAGWLIGLVIIAFYAIFGSFITALLEAGKFRAQLISAAFIVLIMNAINPDGVGIAGVFFGLTAGYSLMKKHIRFSVWNGLSNSKKKYLIMLARYILGIIVATLIYSGLKALLPGHDSPHYRLARFFRYSLLGFWVSVGAPWLFIRMGLAYALHASHAEHVTHAEKKDSES